MKTIHEDSTAAVVDKLLSMENSRELLTHVPHESLKEFFTLGIEDRFHATAKLTTDDLAHALKSVRKPVDALMTKLKTLTPSQRAAIGYQLIDGCRFSPLVPRFLDTDEAIETMERMLLALTLNDAAPMAGRPARDTADDDWYRWLAKRWLQTIGKAPTVHDTSPFVQAVALLWSGITPDAPQDEQLRQRIARALQRNEGKTLIRHVRAG